ncbi:MAG TPA: hypothetical protein ENN53_07320 [Candidatus Acetothermia bacterium]|nr:hypothetical protein [Candidatus Acetothermia bacterium]
MRALVAGLALLAAGVVGGAATLGVGSSAQVVLFGMPTLNAFVRLTNQALAFVNERVDSDPVPPLPELGVGVGFRLSETIGSAWQLGLRVAVAGASTRTQGSWEIGGGPYPVDVSLDVGLATFGAELSLVLIPDLLTVTVSAGWGASRIAYRCVFPSTLPTDWSLPFLPRVGDKTYTGGGAVGTMAVQLSLPVGRGTSAGLEVGFRLAPWGAPRAGAEVLDLNADGTGDAVGFTSMWLGLTVRMEFNL